MKIYKYRLSGEIPSKKNSRINTRSGRSFPNKKFTQWHNAAIIEIATTGALPGEPIKTPCRVTIELIHGDRRPRDPDNAAASVMDLLQDAGIIFNDKWEIVRQLFILSDYDKDNARANIQIETTD